MSEFTSTVGRNIADNLSDIELVSILLDGSLAVDFDPDRIRKIYALHQARSFHFKNQSS